MRAALNVEFTFEQVLSIVKQLPSKQKIKLTKELEKDGVSSILSTLLKSFKTDELSLDLISRETEIVRQQLYEKQKH